MWGRSPRTEYGPEDTRDARCYRCGAVFAVSVWARTVACAGCRHQLVLDDLLVHARHWGSPLQTCGVVVVERKGQVVNSRIIAMEGVHVNGLVEADILSGGELRLGPRADFKGDCQARSLSIEPGATIRGGLFQIGPDRPVIEVPKPGNPRHIVVSTRTPDRIGGRAAASFVRT